ncbi:MAG: hypothetical protein KAJ58_02190 [Candidatus Pacebacteria bacterium]|nr:hypothetical protein [Candidatus Paceibacterota bacterium]
MNIINHQEVAEEKVTLMQSLKRFYFTSEWQSLLTIPYLFLFLYFAIFYIDNIFFAIRFIFRTFTVSTTLLSLSHVLWGAVLVVAVSMPFVISLAMISVLPNIWKKVSWKKDQKILITIGAFIAAIFLMSIANDLILAVGQREILDVFMPTGGSILEI